MLLHQLFVDSSSQGTVSPVPGLILIHLGVAFKSAEKNASSVLKLQFGHTISPDTLLSVGLPGFYSGKISP